MTRGLKKLYAKVKVKKTFHVCDFKRREISKFKTDNKFLQKLGRNLNILFEN